MKKFRVSITETYISNLDLCAFDAEDAVNQAMELFCDGPTKFDNSTIVALNVDTRAIDCLCDNNKECPHEK